MPSVASALETGRRRGTGQQAGTHLSARLGQQRAHAADVHDGAPRRHAGQAGLRQVVGACAQPAAQLSTHAQPRRPASGPAPDRFTARNRCHLARLASALPSRLGSASPALLMRHISWPPQKVAASATAASTYRAGLPEAADGGSCWLRHRAHLVRLAHVTVQQREAVPVLLQQWVPVHLAVRDHVQPCAGVACLPSAGSVLVLRKSAPAWLSRANLQEAFQDASSDAGRACRARNERSGVHAAWERLGCR